MTPEQQSAFDALILELRPLVRGLPASVPKSGSSKNIQRFVKYTPDASWVESEGIWAAVNRDLECSLNPSSAAKTLPDGQRFIELPERGPALEAAINALVQYGRDDATAGDLPIRWATDLLASTKYIFEQAGVPLPTRQPSRDLQKGTGRSQDSDSEDESDSSVEIIQPPSKPSTKRKKAPSGQTSTAKQVKKRQRKAKDEPKATNAHNLNHKFSDLVDCPDTKVKKGKGGGKTNELTDRLVIRCKTISDESIRWRCAMDGCEQSWGDPRHLSRIAEHIVCAPCRGKVPRDLYDECVKAGISLGIPGCLAKRDEDPDWESDDDTAFAKTLRTTALERKELATNSAIIDFICANSLPTSLIGSPTFLYIFHVLEPHLKIRSVTEFVDKLIPARAYEINEKSIKSLKKEDHLTATCDGLTTRSVESIYTVHATRPGPTRDAYLLLGDESSGTSHTGEHIRDVILRALKPVGLNKFSAISTDSTGNMKVARDLIAEAHPHIIVLPDPCHLWNNTVKDIVKIPYFKPAKDGVRSIAKYFKKSSYARAHLKAARLEAGISRGTKSMGNTRFVGMYWSGTTVLDVIPLIDNLIRDRKIKLTKKVGIYWMHDRTAVFNTTNILRQLLAILEPFARSVKCLESSHSTPATVYLYWLGIQTSLTDLFANNNDPASGLQLPQWLISKIISIGNQRWREATEEDNTGNANGGTVYLAAVFLDPSLAASPIFKRRNHNPLTPSITLAARNAAASPSANSDDDLRQTYPCYVEVGKFIFKQILGEAASARFPEMFTPYDSEEEITEATRQQYAAYVRRQSPFFFVGWDKLTPRNYWERLLTHPEANLLALIAFKLYSVVPNSIAEERTVSRITKTNSAHRARQKASTIIRLTQIQQYVHRRDAKAPDAASKAPVVRFCDLSKHIKHTSAKTASPPTATSSTAASSSASAAPPPSSSTGSRMPKGVEEEDEWVDTDDEEDTDVEDGDDDAPPSTQGDMPEDATRLLVSDAIDLSAPYLHDLLSTEPTTPSLTTHAAAEPPVSATPAQPKVFKLPANITF